MVLELCNACDAVLHGVPPSALAWQESVQVPSAGARPLASLHVLRHPARHLHGRGQHRHCQGEPGRALHRKWVLENSQIVYEQRESMESIKIIHFWELR